MTTDTTTPFEIERRTVEQIREARKRIDAELSKTVVGQKEVVEQLLYSLFSGGHCLITGAPGLAKTLLVRSIAQVFHLKFQRIQFTPDLMPADITGTEILEDDGAGRRRMQFVKGPIFANVLLADEINRTPPKTQAALLQAMQERQVTAGGHTLDLPDPFFVMATQNPIEQEGTYPLPEAQLDRFMFMVTVGYPSAEEELEVLKRTTGEAEPQVERVLSAEQVIALQNLVRRVPVGDAVYEFALAIARATRPGEPGASDFVRHWLSWGAGPRAGQFLILAGKARALMHGRLHVTTQDIEAVAPAVLRHRIVPSFNAEAEGVTVEQIVDKILALVPRVGGGERLL